MTLPNVAYNSSTIRVETPNGTMFVNILENQQGNPFKVIINLGKAGTPVSAWANALAELCSVLLERGMSITDLIVHLSGITSERYKASINGPVVRSGPAGLVIALLKYRDSNYAPIIDDELTDIEYYRPPRLHKR